MIHKIDKNNVNEITCMIPDMKFTQRKDKIYQFLTGKKDTNAKQNNYGCRTQVV